MAGILDKFRLDGKVAWVTGASYGLGLAYAKAFAEAGAKKVVFNDINQELVDRGIAEYQKLGIDAYGVVCDVTNEEQVNALVKDIEEKFGGVDILVNNAGIIKRIPMVEMTKQQWDQVINVDLTGPFLCAKAVLPGMIKKGYGKIINACSMMSELGRETVSAYAAAKGGLKMLTKNICSEYGEYNIQCNGIGRLLRFVQSRQTVPWLRLIVSSVRRHLHSAGARQRTSRVSLYSSLLRHLTSSTVRSYTSMVVSSRTSVRILASSMRPSSRTLQALRISR